MITRKETVRMNTPAGEMQAQVFRADVERKLPSIIFYSEIFQITAPIARSANILAGLGFVVIVPEVFHELNPHGTVLGYDEEGKDKGNNDKWTKPLESHDADTRAMIDYLHKQPYCTQKVGAMGVCIGGHLAFRAALNPDIAGAFCLYPTDIHSDTLRSESGNDSFSRANDIGCEVVLVFGKQDPHVPGDGRQKLYAHFQSVGLDYQWIEVNAQHAFMRDEGDRYDPALAIEMYSRAQQFFQRTLW
jgi:carboxymethylenebutenolidase